MHDLPSTGHRPAYPPGFRQRRGLNWGIVGLLYTSFYMCRYNFSLANESIAKEFGYAKSDMQTIINVTLFAYACGQIINGLLTDRLGGRRAMLIGAIGTITLNLLFGIASFWGIFSLFVMLRGIDGYFQAFGAPGMIKINSAWFAHTERGRFAGIFGFMINLGRFGIFRLGPALLSGFLFLGLWQVPPLHWRWLFWVPAGVAVITATCLAFFVKDTPEQAGFPAVHPSQDDAGGVLSAVGVVFRKIVRTPVVWVIALAYACTGAVRQNLDHWFPRYMSEVHHVDKSEFRFQLLAFLMPMVASLGSLISGYVSDNVFNGRRAPVAAGIYFLEGFVVFAATQVHSVDAAIVMLILISLTVNSTHSILGTAAAMDIGGAKMAGFASGVIDSFQYFGGSAAGYFLGKALDRGWEHFFPFFVPFGFVAGILMCTIMNKTTHGDKM
ncbi:MAG: MFS transporter [Verrucomicrobiaceae bacterium]|nr:MFS transporter [Verrucomicrobiaceae bacterium]